MIKLNLLSPQLKEYLRYEQVYLSLRSVIMLILTFTIIISTLFMSARLMLQDNYGTLLSSSTLVNDKNSAIDKEIVEFNRKLKDVNKIQIDFVKWSKILLEITSAIPENIEVSYLNLEKNTHTFNLNGVAQKRDDFLKLKQNLEQLPQLEGVDSPTNNLLLRENVTFQISAKIKPSVLKL